MPKCRCLVCLTCLKVSRMSIWKDDTGPVPVLEQQVGGQGKNLSASHKTLNDVIRTVSNLEYLTQISVLY